MRNRRPSSPRQGETRRPALHVRGRQPVRHLRLQAAPHRTQRAEIRSRREGRTLSERPGPGHGQPVGVGSAWRFRQMDEQPRPAPRPTIRPHELLPVDGRQVQRPRPCDLHAKHRVRAAGLSLRGRLALLRPRTHDRPVAHLRRTPRRARLRPQRPRQSFGRLPARSAPRHAHPRRPARPHPRSLSAFLGGLHHPRERIRRPDSARGNEPCTPGGTRGRLAAGGPY